MVEKEIPVMPLKVRELGITEEEWRRAHSNPLANSPRDIAMSLKISPKLLVTEKEKTGNFGLTQVAQAELAVPQSRQLLLINLDLVDANPFQNLVRSEYDHVEMEEVVGQLVEAFKKGDLSGFVMQVRLKPSVKERYELVYGHLRLEAARRYGIKMLPGIICELSDREMFRQLVEENEHRCNASIISLAFQVRFSVEKFNWSFKELSGLYGRSVKFIHTLYHLAYAPQPFLAFVHEHQEFARVIAEMVEYRLAEQQQQHILNILEEPNITPGVLRREIQLLLPLNSGVNGVGKAGEDIVEAEFVEYGEEETKPAVQPKLLSEAQPSNSKATNSSVYQQPPGYNKAVMEHSTPRPIRTLYNIEESMVPQESSVTEFTPVTPQEKELLDQLEGLVNRLEQQAHYQKFSEEFKLGLVEIVMRISRIQ
ncbi:MAG TPA: ParB N-terminal domain-containing protein [Chloroflexia bacterium]|nr:ParB N-terminal domain-containing protein [Chloroflexia bacterium]